ncbi:SMC3 protein [Trifolium medium]|uniref:SMC3 protein n=1 Tax=Trifolium medium TaxID=97028 RepID=A0A392MK09_9FABA|nr:SMC3 protein [Trifolium medium]
MFGYDSFNMYIKKVEIEGFKSYREKFATEDFSPKVNCVGISFMTCHVMMEAQ